MNSGTHKWKALLFLKKLKRQRDGFEYRMHFDNDGIPDGIVWMSLCMRKLLLRYGNILSLDAQKRQFNNMGWPYIGPVVKTNDNKIRILPAAFQKINHHTHTYTHTHTHTHTHPYYTHTHTHTHTQTHTHISTY